MDEATSALDNRTQEIVSQSLAQLNVTRIVIAHRLATIQKADQILVLEKGQIVERGNHQELLKLEGKYKELYELQFENEAPAVD